jgi:hypothetical protein
MASTCLPCLVIRLVIQTIRQDPSGSIQTDEAINVSRPDPSGADRTDAERQATDLMVARRWLASSGIPEHLQRY